jgi:hypothetical protein
MSVENKRVDRADNCSYCIQQFEIAAVSISFFAWHFGSIRLPQLRADRNLSRRKLIKRPPTRWKLKYRPQRS